MKKIIWRNDRFVIFDADSAGQFEARRIESLGKDDVPGQLSFAAWFASLEEAIGFAQKPLPKAELFFQ
jgi:hypothetical protein